MPIFSFHLVKTTLATTANALLHPPTTDSAAGLRRAECMTVMALGSPILSPARMQLRHLAVFASWESERALDTFLMDTELGRTLATGWHVRLEFLRRWGRLSELDDLPVSVGDVGPATPVVAVTLARLKLSQVPRFVRWGKPPGVPYAKVCSCATPSSTTLVSLRFTTPSTFLRQTFIEWVGQTVPRSFWVQAFYKSCSARGVRHQAALRARAYPPQRVILETDSCSGYAVLRGEKAPDDALARELGAMGLL